MNPPEEVVYLEPWGAFHLGERGIGLEETAVIVHADTLHAALVTAASILEGRDAVDRLAGTNPSVLLSSAFPFAGPVRFYPRPMIPPREAEAQPAGDVKWKDVAYISEQLLTAHLTGRPYPSVEVIHGGTALLSGEEAEALRRFLGMGNLAGLNFWAKATAPRVALDVASQRSGIWHFGRVAFHPGAGFFFRVRYRHPDFVDRFRAIVRLLADTGLGGDRSSGHGLFKARFEEARAVGEPSADRFLTLAPVYPPPDQLPALLGSESRYRWLIRGGWISGAAATPYRRRTVRMLAEGSLLTGAANSLWGTVVDVTPEGIPEPLPFRVLRYGFAFAVGVPPWEKCSNR